MPRFTYPLGAIINDFPENACWRPHFGCFSNRYFFFLFFFGGGIFFCFGTFKLKKVLLFFPPFSFLPFRLFMQLCGPDRKWSMCMFTEHFVHYRGSFVIIDFDYVLPSGVLSLFFHFLSFRHLLCSLSFIWVTKELITFLPNGCKLCFRTVPKREDGVAIGVLAWIEKIQAISNWD